MLKKLFMVTAIVIGSVTIASGQKIDRVETTVDYYHAYFSLGFWLSKFRKTSGWNYELNTNDWYSSDEDCGTRACPYYNSEESHYHNKFYNLFYGKDVYGGMSFHLGISF